MDIELEMQNLVNWLTEYRPMQKSFIVHNMKRYYRIACKDGNSAFCFVVKEDFETKTLGKMKKGDLLCPATWSNPTRHARGLLFDKSTWNNAFTEYGMKMLRS